MDPSSQPKPPADADATMTPVDPASAMTMAPNQHTAPTAIAGGGDATAATVVAGGQGTVVGDQGTAATVITQGPVNALDALVGRTLGGCRIESLLGRGGMGAVFKAQQESLGRAVALKVMLPGRDADPQFASRFQREARVVASLNHPHVVQVYDTGRGDDGMLYLLMEFVDGRSLAQVIRDQGPLPIPVVLAIMREAAEGLAAAHAKALVHRDIKPDNLMIDAAGRVKVMDFGLARPTEGGSGDSALTMSGMILGTPNYISPEAARGEPADIRADLYSLGVTLWQCVAGKLPFTGPTPVQVLVQHIEAAPPDLAAAMPSCPRTVAALCQRLLAKRADDRFSTPAELVTAITAIEHQLCGRSARLRWEGRILVADATLSAETKPARSHTPAIMATLVVILALVGVTIGAVWYALRSPEPTEALATTPDAPAPGVATVAPEMPASSDPVVPAIDAPPADSVSTPIEHAVATTPVPAQTAPTPVVVGEPTPTTIAATSPTLPAEPAEPAEPPPVAVVAAPAQAPAEPAPTAPVVAPALPSEPPPVASVEPPAEPLPSAPVAAPALPSEPPPVAAIEPPAAAPRAPALVPIATVPPAVPARPASLFVSSIPSGATVELDGVAKGKTPCNIAGLTAGEHRLRVHGNGIDERTVVVLPGGRVTRISTPLPEPARLELLDLPAQARVTVDGKPYASGMAVLTGTITVQVISSGGARAFQVDTVVGRNVLGYTE